MPFDGTPPLDIPSLEALSYALRHRELWPSGFVWEFNNCNRCAMGLAWRLWSFVGSPELSPISRVFGISYEVADRLFYHLPERLGMYYITLRCMCFSMSMRRSLRST